MQQILSGSTCPTRVQASYGSSQAEFARQEEQEREGEREGRGELCVASACAARVCA